MNLVDVLKLDMGTLEEEYRKLANVLGKLGMTEYEARVYVSLIAKGFGTAEEVADLAGIPRTSAYKALQSLAEKQFVTVSDGRPTIFHPVPLEETRGRVLGDIEELFEKLEAIKGMMSEKGAPQLVFTIAGKKRVIAKIGEMLDSSKSTFIISTSAMPEIRTEHAQRFKDAVKRGVKLTIIAEPLVKLPQATAVFRKKGLVATDVISDSTSAMIASPDLSLCGFSDNPFISSHLENFITAVIERLRGEEACVPDSGESQKERL
jgi:sugar-specific transcriptional regulator TrmB